MFELTEKIVQTAFKAGWLASDAAAVPIRWPNVPWKQPVSNEWIALHIIDSDGMQASLGSVLERQFAVAIIQICTPKNSGTRRAKVLCDIAASILRRVTLSESGITVVFETPAAAKVGDSSGIFQHNVNIPFRSEKIFS